MMKQLWNFWSDLCGFYYFGGDCSLGPLLVILLNALGLFVHTEATKNNFFSSHVPSYSMPSFLHLCSSSHRADGCPHNERLKGDKLFGYPLLFQILWSNPFSCGTSGGLRTIFCVWLFSFGLPPNSWDPLPTLHVVERLSHPPSPPGHCAVLTAPCCCGICPPCVLHDLMQC